ncbi:MAG: hypothetical protein IIA62_03075, partial [Nitrospinae bacterium]|nr:hypothetical protein [Nitrospinota bacterium]
QLLDAIDLLGDRADWNQLVFQFCTKNWDDHELLKSAETLPLPTTSQPLGMERPELDPRHFAPAEYEGQIEAAGAKMPRFKGYLSKPSVGADPSDTQRRREIAAKVEKKWPGQHRPGAGQAG